MLVFIFYETFDVAFDRVKCSLIKENMMKQVTKLKLKNFIYRTTLQTTSALFCSKSTIL